MSGPSVEEVYKYLELGIKAHTEMLDEAKNEIMRLGTMKKAIEAQISEKEREMEGNSTLRSALCQHLAALKKSNGEEIGPETLGWK